MNVVPMTPITSVKVLSNVPLDNSYRDTLYFTSVSQQTNYFVGKQKFTFNNLTPVKMQNKIRLPITADKLYDCNYIMFQNSNFGVKWFYAFISKIDYININMCEIEIEIDVFQTWLFDVTFKPSLVMREHSGTNYVGDNMVVENIDFGFYIDEPHEKTPYFDLYDVVLATTFTNSEGKTGGNQGGLFSGLTYLAAPMNKPSDIDTLLNFIDITIKANKIDAITNIFMMPSEFYTISDIPVFRRFDASYQNSKIGSYIPRNKKLLTYPYNFLYVYTPDGANTIYRYEFFANNTCGFNLQCGMSCNPEIILEPINYMNQQFNVDETMVINGFPQCAFSVDSYKAWLAQNSTSSLLSLSTQAIGLASGEPTTMAFSAMGMASTLNSVAKASLRPPQIRGSQSTSTFTATREKNFYFVNKHISEEYAKIIDDFFDLYGYATNRVKVPNMNNRPSWNYVKTKDSKIVGSVPFNDISAIREMFDSGVTLWHGDWVGDYSRNNNI